MMSGVVDLPVPSGIYWVVNPYYDISGVVATLSDAKQKYPNNMECAHPGLCEFYTILKPQDFGPDIDVVLFWFRDGLLFCSIGVGPFGRRANYEEEMKNFKAFTQKVGVPESWLHLIWYNNVK